MGSENGQFSKKSQKSSMNYRDSKEVKKEECNVFWQVEECEKRKKMYLNYDKWSWKVIIFT